MPGALETTVKGERKSATKVSANGGFLLAKASANLEAKS